MDETPTSAHETQRVFDALADPVRRAILERLSDGPASAGTVASWFDITRPAVSRHLRLLREAGLVRTQVAGRRHIYELDVTATDPVTMWVAGLRSTWTAAFDALETEVYRTRRERRQRPETIKEQTA